MNFSQIPKVWKAIQYMASCNGIELVQDAEKLELPLDDDILIAAERVAEQLDESPLRAIVNVDHVDVDCAGHDDDALETIADGEHSVVTLIRSTVPGAETLHEVLNSAFDGEINELISAN